MKLAMNHATFRYSWNLPDFIKGCADRNIRQVSVWSDEIDQFGLDAFIELINTNEMEVFGYNRAGPFLSSDPKQRTILIDKAKLEIDKAAAVRADHVLLFSGGLSVNQKGLDGAQDEALETIETLLEHARAQSIHLALEPLHPMLAGDRACINTFSHANDICDQLGEGIGIVIDAYHVWWDRSLKAELIRSSKHNRIFGFHANDWLIPTKHLLTDRGMMGDGVIDLDGIWQMVKAAGYRGPIEVEIFSDDWWKRDPDYVCDLAIKRCHQIFQT